MTTRLASPASPASAGSPVLRAYDRCVDGLFTYCLSVLCEHDAAVAALCEVRDLALRHGDRPADPALGRAWLYALARHCCLERLERGTGAPAEPPPGPAQADRRRAELASLAWPEAAGTDPEQREALELAVRHRLSATEVAAVLGRSDGDVQELLSAAGAEVGRTRSALLVLGVGSCPVLARLGGVGAESWRGWVLGPALRRELVQHVVDCPTCRGTAERVGGELGTGLAGLPGLPLLAAPVPVRLGGTAAQLPDGAAGAAFLAGAAAGRRATAPAAWSGGEPSEPRFDQRGFPRHRAPSAGRSLVVRQRVVTTGVLAAVLTAPMVALWAAQRDGGGTDASAAVSSVRVAPGPVKGPPKVPAQPAAAPVVPVVPLVQAGSAGSGDVRLVGAVTAETSFPAVRGAVLPVLAVPVPPRVPVPGPSVPGTGDSAAAGWLTVEAQEYGSRTVITLTNAGGTAIAWHAVVDADWLRLSRDYGTLAPGQRITVTVTVDDTRVPPGTWTARIALPPSEAVVTLEGGPRNRGGEEPTDAPTPMDPSPATPTDGPAPSSPDPASGTPSTPPSPEPSTPSPPSSPSSPSPAPTGQASGQPADPAPQPAPATGAGAGGGTPGP
ncbi:sigma-70 family RNA polymerase sigma factor [Kitasatospora sp. NPDC088346]|uniref:BACON domain-containing protein n=1 Tax=Kitasatospora sp. NPDC088346 TaxID=3364073 RepID=UPI003808E99F